MYSVAGVGVGVGVGVGWVDASHSARYDFCARSISMVACRGGRRRITQDLWFRVGEVGCSDWVRERRETQFGGVCGGKAYRSDGFVIGSGRRRRRWSRVSSTPGGDLSLLSETLLDVCDVREGTLEEAILKQDFIDSGGDDVVALGYGWKVREASRFDTEELRAVAHVQACSFHLQAAVFDDLFFKLFKAEVLSALIYKARHSPAERYACLMAEPVTSVESSDEYPPMIVGAVNLAASVDNEVLRHLHSATEYLYVSGMAVDINYRRRNIATMLLRGCELLAMKWGFDYLTLHAYEDDTAARTLYDRGGYRVVALDPLWISTWVGRKRRVLMAKRTSRTPFDF